MCKTLILLSTLLVVSFISYGQEDDCELISFLGSESNSKVLEAVVGLDASVYMVGETSSDIDVSLDGGSEILNFTSNGVYVAKYLPSKELFWSKTLASEGNMYVTCMFVNEETLFIGGSYHGTVDFDPSPIEAISTTPGYSDAFLLALDLNGAYLWHATFGHPNHLQSVQGISDGDAGGPIIVGGFIAGIDANPDSEEVFEWSTQGTNDADGFMIKLTAQGIYEWSSALQGDGYQTASSVFRTDNGWVIAGASTIATHYVIDDEASPIQAEFSGVGLESFLLLVSEEGEYLNGSVIGGEGDDFLIDVIYDGDSDRIFTAGYCSGPGDYAPGIESFSPQVFGGKDGLVACYTTDLELQWLTTYGGYLDDNGVSLSLKPDGRIECVGYFRHLLDASVDLSEEEVVVSGYPFTGLPDALYLELDTEGEILTFHKMGGEDIDQLDFVCSTSEMLIYGGHVHKDELTELCEIEATGINPNYQGFVYWNAGSVAVPGPISNANASSCSVYYDHFAQVLNIECPGGAVVHLFTGSGQRVSTVQLDGKRGVLSTEKLAPGVYLVRIQHKDLLFGSSSKVVIY